MDRNRQNMQKSNFDKCHCDVTMTHIMKKMTLKNVEGNKPTTDSLFESWKSDHQKRRYERKCSHYFFLWGAPAAGKG
jgi:hypothetical protein